MGWWLYYHGNYITIHIGNKESTYLLVGFEDTLGFFVEMRVEQWFGYNINKGHWWF